MAIKKVLILAANPLETARLRLEKEVEEIRVTLERSPNRDNFAIKSRGALRPQDLQTHLFNLKPQILHFSGHGDGDQGLAFENEAGGVKLVSTEALANTFKLFSRDVQCVVLNACYAVVQAEAIAQHIPYVIGMNQAIGDEAARRFAEGFYRAIWDDRSIEDAFDSGVNAIGLEDLHQQGIPEELTPVLLKRSLLKPNPNTEISVVENNGYFYIVRSRLEQRCYEEVMKAGTLIRIKSPERMGKSMMMGRVLEYASQQGYRTAAINLHDAKGFFTDINKFLLWFCAYIGDSLEIEQRPEDAWKGFLGANTNCTKYVEKFFLNGADSPLVIAIDNFDYVFQYPNIEADFCGLLRGWFEKANNSKVWGKLRQIIVYSSESSTVLNINQSPFNVGLPIELDELDISEVLALALVYKLPWTIAEVEMLTDAIGGHPELVQKAIDRISHQSISLEALLRTAPTEEGIYKDHLVKRLQKLEENPDLVAAMKLVVNSDLPVNLRVRDALKLDSLGLIKRHGNDIVSRCNLYRLYFKDRLR
jgi:hypothetical protein